MILVDTSVWVDHLRKSEPVLNTLLNGNNVLLSQQQPISKRLKGIGSTIRKFGNTTMTSLSVVMLLRRAL